MSLSAYPAYKESGVEWVGSIPSHWNVVPLKNLIQIQNGEDHKEFEQNEGIPVFGSGGHFSYASKWLYDGESVLLGRKGTIDRPLYIKGKFWAVDTMFWSKIAPVAFGKFIYYSSLIIPFGYYSNSTALPSMTKNILHNHIVAYPPIEEQTAIAVFLDRETGKIDALIAEQEKLLTLLAEKRQATISHAVTRGLNPNAPMKDSGIAWLGEVPEHWEVKKLAMLADNIGDGLHGTPTYVEDSNCYFINGNNLASGKIVITENTRCVSKRERDTQKINLGDNSTLLSINGTIGNVALYFSEEVMLGKSAAYINCGEKINRIYLMYFLMSDYCRSYFEQSLSGTTIHNLSLETIRSTKILLPRIIEQKEIVLFLEGKINRLTSLEAEAVKFISLLKERRSALIAAAVTGKIDVRNTVSKGEAA